MYVNEWQSGGRFLPLLLQRLLSCVVTAQVLLFLYFLVNQNFVGSVAILPLPLMVGSYRLHLMRRYHPLIDHLPYDIAVHIDQTLSGPHQMDGDALKHRSNSGPGDAFLEEGGAAPGGDADQSGLNRGAFSEAMYMQPELKQLPLMPKRSRWVKLRQAAETTRRHAHSISRPPGTRDDAGAALDSHNRMSTPSSGGGAVSASSRSEMGIDPDLASDSAATRPSIDSDASSRVFRSQNGSYASDEEDAGIHFFDACGDLVVDESAQPNGALVVGLEVDSVDAMAQSDKADFIHAALHTSNFDFDVAWAEEQQREHLRSGSFGPDFADEDPVFWVEALRNETRRARATRGRRTKSFPINDPLDSTEEPRLTSPLLYPHES